MPLDMLERALLALHELNGPPATSTHGRHHTEPDGGPGPRLVTDVRGRIDWTLIADALGTRLPEDYVELAHRYQGLVIDNWLGVRMPRPGLEPSYVEAMREDLLDLEDAWMAGDSGGHVPFPRQRGLLPWGGSIDGDTFYWRTHPDGPQAWTVVVCDACDSWEEVNRDLTGYLAGLVLGEVEPGERREGRCPKSRSAISADEDGKRRSGTI
jgi:hypothetical protein